MPSPDQPPQHDALLEMALNLSAYHHEHEKYYAHKPLEAAQRLHGYSLSLKTLAARWENVAPSTVEPGSPYAGADDLNEFTTIQSDGVLFMEGEGEPAEITRLKQDLATTADEAEQTGAWLAQAMHASWEVAKSLLEYPALADLLAERHRVIGHDWQNANTNRLIAQVLRRVGDVLGKVDFSPVAIRADLGDRRSYPKYLYSASELIDYAIRLTIESTTLVLDNERRWRVFHTRVAELTRTPRE
jgi:hypothetical protein